MKKHPPTASSIGYPNIYIIYSGFLSQPKMENEDGSLDCAQDLENMLESIKI
jgi:hypothetical protein